MTTPIGPHSANDPAVSLFDNVGPNDLHAEPTLAAIRAGKHVVCEKPLAVNGDEAWELLQAAQSAGIKHMCAFNYRFVPAVRLARDLIRDGELGEIRHFRARYLQDWLADPNAPVTWRLRSDSAGSGSLGDLGSHIIDLARFLVGEIVEVAGAPRRSSPIAVARRPMSMRRSRPWSGSSRGPAGRSRPRVLPWAAPTHWCSRSTERADRPSSTSSG